MGLVVPDFSSDEDDDDIDALVFRNNDSDQIDCPEVFKFFHDYHDMEMGSITNALLAVNSNALENSMLDVCCSKQETQEDRPDNTTLFSDD